MRRIRSFARLLCDAVEALIYALNSNRAADALWKRAKKKAAAERLAEAEAEQEVWSPFDENGNLRDELFEGWKHIEPLREPK
jgi:hypothetical protein